MTPRTVGWGEGEWSTPPASVRTEGDHLAVTCREGSDLWRTTEYGFVHDDGHGLLADLPDKAAVEVTYLFDGDRQFDQAGLLVRADEAVNRIVPELIRSGKIVRPGLGVQIADEQIAQRLGVSGVLVVDVARGSAAAKAGIQPTRRDAEGRLRLGDVITAIDGKKVSSPNDLYLLLEKYRVGESVTLSLLREGKPVQTKVALEAIQ